MSSWISIALSLAAIALTASNVIRTRRSAKRLEQSAAIIRASQRPGPRLVVGSAEGTRMKGLRRIPKERREAAVTEMLRRAK